MFGCTCTYTRTRIYVHMCLYVYMLGANMCIFSCMGLCVSICIYIYIAVFYWVSECVCIYVCLFMCVYVCRDKDNYMVLYILMEQTYLLRYNRNNFYQILPDHLHHTAVVREIRIFLERKLWTKYCVNNWKLYNSHSSCYQNSPKKFQLHLYMFVITYICVCISVWLYISMHVYSYVDIKPFENSDKISFFTKF